MDVDGGLPTEILPSTPLTVWSDAFAGLMDGALAQPASHMGGDDGYSGGLLHAGWRRSARKRRAGRTPRNITMRFAEPVAAVGHIDPLAAYRRGDPTA
jgi:hypothetical protein